MEKEMCDEWHKKVLITSKRLKDEDYEKFVSLIEMIEKDCSFSTVKTLMKTYFDNPDDFGTQESVESTLSLAKPQDVILATLEELTRLENEASTWILIGVLVDNEIDLLIKISKTMPEETKQILLNLLSDKDFYDDYPNSIVLKKELEN